eukprot:SAG31_NODE_41800_length_274_cov_0.880000_1_plen_23_part_10
MHSEAAILSAQASKTKAAMLSLM